MLSTVCSKNDDADQLRSYCAAYLHLCFRIHVCKKQVSHDASHFSIFHSDILFERENNGIFSGDSASPEGYGRRQTQEGHSCQGIL